MRRSDYGIYAKLVGLALAVAILATIIAYYIATLVAIHLTILFLAAMSSGRRSTNPQGEALAVGILVALGWVAIPVLVLAIAVGGRFSWIVGAVAAAPLALVVSWQVKQWQESDSWARFPGGLRLGRWRTSRFFVSRPYTVTPGERLKHLVCTGPTGSGKSTLVRNLVVQDLVSGSGLCVIDPKDDLVDGILPHVPRSRADDVILFDATDTKSPLGLNPLAGVPPHRRSLAASELISVFHRYFSDAWGPRLEHLLRNVVLALLEVPGATLLDIPRLLLDRSYCQRVISQVTNPAVREFFIIEYEEILRRRADAIEPVLNKVGPWLSYPELRGIIGQPTSAFDLRHVMDSGQVLFVRIPQGALGEDGSNLLGALVVAKIQLAAQSRVDQQAAFRRPFQLYVDEFQNFATSSFTKILTEARAFGLGLVCVNQYPEQLSRELQLALSRNAATFVQTVYRRGQYLAEVARQEDREEKKPHVFVVGPPGPLPPGDESWAAELRAMSRIRYGSSTDLALPVRQSRNGAREAVPARSWGHDVEEE